MSESSLELKVERVDPEEIIIKLKRLIQYFRNQKPNHDEEKLSDSHIC